MFGGASALQHQEARAVESSARPSLLLTLARRPVWLIGIAIDFTAVGLQGLALRLGSVSLVQTLLVSGLPLAAVLSGLLARRWLRRPEVLGLLLCSAGLGLLGPALATTPQGHSPSRHAALVAGVVIVLVALPLLALRHHPRLGGAAAGAAAGVVIGAGSVLLAVTAGRVGDWSHLFGSWAVYATLVVGLAGLLLAQVAFQTGDLGAPLAALSILEPVVAVVLAVNVIGERPPPLSLPAVLGGVCAVAGVLVLTRD
ncbi:MAG: integral rane protein [Frankiales bacterium]|nr:integral rane protein [Frankiales bacterium]